MRFKIKLIADNGASTVCLSESDARHIAGNRFIDDAIAQEQNNSGLDGTQIEITDTMAIIVVQH